MGQVLGGTGFPLPAPQNYYPSQLYNAPPDPSSNVMALAPADALQIPAGRFVFDLSPNLIVQYLDPVNGIWDLPRSGQLQGLRELWSDGTNLRIANLTGCPVCAVVTAGGSGYVQASTSVTASGSGGSTWQAVVGGQLSLSTISVAGSGYGVPPIVFIPPPPSPGVQASAYSTITGGSVTGVTLNNVGGGYLTAPTAVLIPSPFDPNINNQISAASIVLATVNSGVISAVYCTNNGQSVSSPPTLTVSGTGGSGASVTAVMMQTMTGVSVASGGTGYTGGAGLVSFGGIPTVTPVYTNPLIQGTDFVPRPANMLLAAPVGGSLVSVAAIYDGGLFLVGTGNPSVALIALGGDVPTASANVTPTMGAATGTYRLQTAP